MKKFAILFIILLLPHSAVCAEINNQKIDTRVSVIFYVKDGANSPYQGLLTFSPAEYAALSQEQLQILEITQFNNWKENTAKLQAYQIEHENDVPQSITSAQARRAILEAGLKESVETAVAAGGIEAQTLWYTADFIERNNVILISLAHTIGLSNQQIDDLFRTAGKM